MEVLHAIFLSIQPSVTTYYNGAARGATTKLTGIAEYTVAGPLTESVYWGYATGALTHKSLLAGRSGSSPVPTWASPDSSVVATNNVLLASITKNAGAYDGAVDGWLATPFTSGSDFGYWRVGTAMAAAQIWQWDFYECQEAAAIVIQQSTVAALFANLTGAWMDPHTTNASDAESDGRLYGQCASAGLGITASIMSASKWNGSNQEFLDHSTTANTEPHAATFNPGLGTLTASQSRSGIYDGAAAACMTSRGSQVMAHFDIPMSLGASGNYLGTLRGMGPGKNTVAGAVLSTGGVDIAYAAFTNSWTGSNQACYLRY